METKNRVVCGASIAGEPVLLTERSIPRAAAMLGRAFYRDPLYSHLMPDETLRREKAAHVFACILRYGIRYGEACAVSPEIEGAAIWIPSENVNLTVRQMLSVGMGQLCFRMGLRFVLRVFPALDFTLALHRRHAPFKHSYLYILGVDPAFRGKKYASALLRPMLARIDAAGLPCYLETCSEENVALYEHFGFSLIERRYVPGTKVPVMPMLRRNSGIPAKDMQ